MWLCLLDAHGLPALRPARWWLGAPFHQVECHMIPRFCDTAGVAVHILRFQSNLMPCCQGPLASASSSCSWAMIHGVVNCYAGLAPRCARNCRQPGFNSLPGHGTSDSICPRLNTPPSRGIDVPAPSAHNLIRLAESQQLCQAAVPAQTGPACGRGSRYWHPQP